MSSAKNWLFFQLCKSRDTFVGRVFGLESALANLSMTNLVLALLLCVSSFIFKGVIAGPAGAEGIARSAPVRPGLRGVTKPPVQTLLMALRCAQTEANVITRLGDAPAWAGSPVQRVKEATVRGAVRDTATVAVCPTMLRTTAVTSRSSTSTMT